MASKHEICELLDKLTLESLYLIEQNVQTTLDLERVSNEGQLLMAKSRYIQGHNSVSASQLPTENSTEFKPLATVAHTEDELKIPQMELESHVVDKTAGYSDPLSWFGVLLPQSLHSAKTKYRKAVELSIESANNRNKLSGTLHNISKLREMKHEIIG